MNSTVGERSGRHRWLAYGLIVITFGVGAAVAWWGGAVKAAGWDGFVVDTGWTPWLLPACRLAMEVAAVVTVGFLLAAAFLVPGQERTHAGRRYLLVSPAGAGWLRGAGWAATGWAAATLAAMCFTLSDLVGLPVTDAVTFSALSSLAVDVETGRALFAVLVLTCAVAAACRYVRTVGGTAIVALLAIAALLPPAFSGHGANSANHQLAVSLLALHIGGAVLWTGGLLAVLLGRRRPVAELAASVRRFSRLAVWCFAAVAATGVVVAVIRLWDWAGMISPFGLLILGKVVALVALGGFGWWHRRRTIPRLAAGESHAFTRLATVEVVVMAATFGLAAALARTPSPNTAEIPAYETSPFGPMLDVLPDPIFFTAALGAIGAYLHGVRRLRDRGESWSGRRSAAWVAGWLLIAVASAVQLAIYSGSLFPAIELAQHLTLILVVPVLLVAGAPVTLARRALRPATEPAMRGPLEWLGVLIGAPATRAAAHPAIAMTLYAVTLFGMYLSVYDSMSLRRYPTRMVIFGLAIVVGAFVLGLVRGGEPAPRPLSTSNRRILNVAASAAQLICGVALILPDRPTPTTVALALLLPVTAVAGWVTRPAEPRQAGSPSEAPVSPATGGLAPEASTTGATIQRR